MEEGAGVAGERGRREGGKGRGRGQGRGVEPEVPLAEEGQRVEAVEELDVDDLKEDESSRASY